jgi:hypothetical protein
MGETVEQLSDKVNVPARAKGYVSDKKDAVVEKITGTKDTLAGGGGSIAETGQSAAGHAQEKAVQGYHLVRDNPIGMAIVGAAAGFAAGTLLPSTQAERDRIGPMADELKSQAGDLASEAVQHGREVLSETADTAKEAGKDHAKQLGSSAQESAQEATQQIKNQE